MQFLRQFNAIALKIAGWSVIVAMAVIAIIVPYEVFGRYVLGNMSMWSNELTQYSLVWASMLGGAVGLKRGYQVGITSLPDSLSPAGARVVQAISFVIVLIFVALLAYYGFDQMWMNRNQTSSTMGIPMSIPYSALPIGFLLMFFVTVEQLVDLLTHAPTEEK
ncbi:TRAP transporter small permease [Propionivibrio dicarboxylicus]|uniref:TRAP transporter small permease protein n=1 Tax=Propionivibrio dicarboxylicus TaxID=83767 RepID=A0A1G8KSV0_9RHOO|nr:TRAP transporter small permease [Propionivibrio dicarboxylicus]SDI46518.1 TRAP-type C4-dicarboxylate transport system, small permease component [Propionivibrio dicarboxylicus]